MATETPTSQMPHIPSDQDRRDLARTFMAWTGNPAIADDLAQETLLAAWTSKRQPESPSEWRPWLFGVARNILLRWRREMAKHGQRIAGAPESEHHLLAASSTDDLDALMTRTDIVDLLDAALGRLPIETRQALLLKYIDDLPQAEIADQMGIHVNALEGRLHRGKRAMHQFLLTERPDSAVSLGLVSEPGTWVATDIWCEDCGEQHLIGRWTDRGELRLDCPACHSWFSQGARSHAVYVHPADTGYPFSVREVRPSFRQAVNQIADRLFPVTWRGIEAIATCQRCGGEVRPRRRPLPSELGDLAIIDVGLYCQQCGSNSGYYILNGSATSHPMFRTWQERHGRIRLNRPRLVHFHGIDAIETTWSSLDGHGLAIVIHDRTTLRTIHVNLDGRTINLDEAT